MGSQLIFLFLTKKAIEPSLGIARESIAFFDMVFHKVSVHNGKQGLGGISAGLSIQTVSSVRAEAWRHGPSS